MKNVSYKSANKNVNHDVYSPVKKVTIDENNKFFES